jgi:hypothetical protein
LGEWATCRNCGLEVEARLIRKGGLPNCEEYESKLEEITQPEEPKSYFQEYFEYYRKGSERYGMFWKIFTFSMIAIAAVFLAAAIILFVFYG